MAVRIRCVKKNALSLKLSISQLKILKGGKSLIKASGARIGEQRGDLSGLPPDLIKQAKANFKKVDSAFPHLHSEVVKGKTVDVDASHRIVHQQCIGSPEAPENSKKVYCKSQVGASRVTSKDHMLNVHA